MDEAGADALDKRAAEAASDLFDVALELARERNVPALKMLLDRVWPASRSRPLEIDAPEIKHPRDLLTVMAGVTHATFSGDAKAKEGRDAAKVLQAHFQAIGDIDLEARLTELEEADRKHRGK